MRGGTANCTVKISDALIGNPMATELDILFTLNEPAIDKFESLLVSGGYLFVNSSVVSETRTYRDDIKVIKLNAGELAASIGNNKGVNLVMLGSVIKHCKLFDIDVFQQGVSKYFADKGKAKFQAKNEEALMCGYMAE